VPVTTGLLSHRAGKLEGSLIAEDVAARELTARPAHRPAAWLETQPCRAD